jgi:hypothetical protein
MNQSAITKFAIVFLGIALGLYVLIESLTTKTAILGKFYLFFAVGAFLTGLFKPKTAIYALIICTAYIDLFKRLMVVSGQPTTFDLACTLATPPLFCAGAMCNLAFSIILRKIKLSKGLVASLCVATAFLLLGVLTLSADGVRGFGGLVNATAYPFLLVLIPVYFPDIEDKRKIFVLIFVVFVGVALYMIKHGIYGLAQFEYDYLLTSLTQEVRILTEGENMRCFSTMNGAGIVSTMCALMFFWSYVNVWKRGALSLLLRMSCSVVFVIACYFTLSRTGWVCGIVAFISYFLFKRWSTTVAAYFLGISSVICLVAFSPLIKDYKVIENAESFLKREFNTGDSRVDQATTLGTFNGRIDGWVNLMTKKHIWTPFGWKLAGKRFKDYELIDLGDDAIFWFIVKYGYIPCFLGGVLMLTFLYKLHRFIQELPYASLEKRIAVVCLASVIGLLSGGLGNAAQMSVFPVNVYLYLCLAFVFSIYLQRKTLVLNPPPKKSLAYSPELITA